MVIGLLSPRSGRGLEARLKEQPLSAFKPEPDCAPCPGPQGPRRAGLLVRPCGLLGVALMRGWSQGAAVRALTRLSHMAIPGFRAFLCLLS